MKQLYKKLLTPFIKLVIAGSVIFCTIITAGYFYYAPTLPSVETLRNIRLQTPLRIYTQDNKLIAEFGERRRIPVAFEQIPPWLIYAFIAAEDNGFYTNSGIDVGSLMRAAWELITTGHIQTGGSTITMQVARNFFLSHERSFSRKFKEILLALQITQKLSKQEIITLYLNKIYLGNRAYGVEAAANIYYGKSISKLSLAQMAMIAELPKAPSIYNPLVNPERAIIRRNWILSRMLKLKYITQEDYNLAVAQPVTARYHCLPVEFSAPYVAEMARQEIVKRYGQDGYYNMKVYTTINSADQLKARQVIIDGLNRYDRRHGYRGAEKNLGNDPELWKSTLKQTNNIANLVPAVVLQVNKYSVNILLKNNQINMIPWQGLAWAKPMIDVNKTGAAPKTADQILKTGDFIWVKKDNTNNYELAQKPQAQGALISLHPESGAIKALIGGYDFNQSHFNRAVQASRQIGSTIKPFLYSAALANGMTAASVINDAPVVIGSYDEEDWRPHNADSKFNGPTLLRKAFYQSRNLVSIRILQQIGITKTLNYIQRFGLPIEQFPDYLSLAVGAVDLTPMQLTSGFAVLANGGYTVKPYLIDKIISPDGLIFQVIPPRLCHIAQSSNAKNADDISKTFPAIQQGEQSASNNCEKAAIDSRVNYIMNNIMQDVIKLGTGRRAKVLHRSDLAGKTGTSNGHKDVWFAGYNPDILTVVWMGKDNSTTLGQWEYGANVALPIWIHYMRYALKNLPEKWFTQPLGLVTVRINKNTGEYAHSDDPDSFFEIFRKELAPSPAQHNTNNNFQPGDIF